MRRMVAHATFLLVSVSWFAGLVTLLQAQVVGPPALVLESVVGRLEVLQDGAWVPAREGTVLGFHETVRVSGATELRFVGYPETVYLLRRGSYEVGAVYHAFHLHKGLDIRALGGEAGLRFPPAALELLEQYGIEPDRVLELVEQGAGALFTELTNSPLASVIDMRVLNSHEFAGLIDAWSAVLRNQIGTAIEGLAGMRTRPGDFFYHELTGLHATLLIESFAYADALELLRGYVRTIDRDKTDALQRAYLLTALAFHGLGNRGAAHMYLRQTRELNPASAMGDTARELLASM